MSKNIAIKVDNIHKSFKIPHEKHSSLKGTVLNLFSNKGFTTYDAANGISFEVKQGEFLGIIGRNGCGKSTMLKMLAGIYQPDSGSIKVSGTLSPFLELGVGFNPELSARDNIYLNGSILGMSRKQIDQIFDKIVSFAELEEFIDMKLKNFSSGMQVRLAFSVAINAHADILLIDEVLAVGDVNFQKKCFEVFRDFKRQGKTVVFVSHDMGSIRNFCDRVLVFSEGNKIFDGDKESAIDKYIKLNKSNDKEDIIDIKNEDLGNGAAKIFSVEILDMDNNAVDVLKPFQKFKILIGARFNSCVKNPSFGIMIRNNPNEDLLGVNTIHNESPVSFGEANPGEEWAVEFEIINPLNPGTYTVSAAISEQENPESYELVHLLENHKKIEIISSSDSWGRVATKSKIKLIK